VRRLINTAISGENMDSIITLDYGSGGRKTSQLIEELILPAMADDELNRLGDGAVLTGSEKLVFSTDSFVIDPLFFPGGDIGELSICGTVNDVSVCGGEIKYISCSLIIEEGFETKKLRKILESLSKTAKKAGVRVVTGDTKVVEKGKCDGVYINTAGIGFLKYPGLGTDKIREGDAVIVSGTVGDHGTAVMLARTGMLEGELASDCAPLNRLCAAVLESGAQVRLLRDPTRGGAATTLNEFVEGSEYGIEIDEALLPVRPQVSAACELLGLDPMYCANEGKLLCICAAEDAQRVLEAMRSCPEGENAAVIGRVSKQHPGIVSMKTAFGGSRIMQKLAGAQLPRIC